MKKGRKEGRKKRKEERKEGRETGREAEGGKEREGKERVRGWGTEGG